MASEPIIVTSEDLKRGLEEIDAENVAPPSRDRSALRQAIADNLPGIRNLLAKGWSRRQICDELKKKVGFQCQYAVFNAYYRQAEEEIAKRAKAAKKAAQAKAEAEE